MKNKLANAPIALIGFDKFRYNNSLWPEKSSTNLPAVVPTIHDLASVTLQWNPNKEHPKVSMIRVSGIWETLNDTETFSFIINLNKTGPNKVIQSDDQKEHTDMKEVNTVEVYGESDAVVVKGAENGASIKICNESGVEIKTVVANNNDIRINLPAKQLYFIHIGNSQYKVAL